MQAVILAAGFGSRLARVSQGRPKCLLEIGGRPLIRHQIETLNDAGIGKVLVVVGHQAHQVYEALGDGVEYLENKRYDQTNSLYSLWLARQWVQGPFVLMNCDLLFQPEIMDGLLSSAGNVLAYDSTSSKGREQTKVAVRDGVVMDLGKDLPPWSARGESLGLLCFDTVGQKLLFDNVQQLVEQGGENHWVIEGIRSVCHLVKLQGYNVAGLHWVEVDFPHDLERARKEVWPAIEKSRWRKAVYWRRTKYLALALLASLLLGIGLWVGASVNKPSIVWTTEPPLHARKVVLKLAHGHQTWWHAPKEAPLQFVLQGPLKLNFYVRLLMAPGCTQPGRYVIQLSVDGRARIWKAFKATPDQQACWQNRVVGDRDRFNFNLPSGRHKLALLVLFGTSRDFIGRLCYPEPMGHEEDAGEEEE